MAKKSTTKQEAPAGLQPAGQPETIHGIASVRYAVAQITGQSAASLGDDDSLGWLNSLKANASGYAIASEKPGVSIKAKHVGIFSYAGELYAAVMQGDDIISNPSDKPLNPVHLTQRLRVTKDQAPAESDKA